MKNKKYSGLDSLIKPRAKILARKTKKQSANGVTPNEIVSAALEDVYGIKTDKESLAAFTGAVVMLLSALATGGQDKALLGKDMDDFFKLYVNTINMCGKMKGILEENGIDFDINGD